MTDKNASQRIDKWLWHARFAKTRSLAQKLVKNGSVRVNRSKVSSVSTLVRIGDILTIALPRYVAVIEVVAFSEKRGAYSVACLLYNDKTPPETKNPTVENNQTDYASIEKEKRPDRRSRKLAIRMKQGSNES